MRCVPVLLAVLSAVLCLTVSPVAAEPLSPYVPEALEPWRNWVLEKEPARQCALVENTRVCIWPTSLKLSLDEQGGVFALEALVERKRGAVDLPGGGGIWPLEVALEKNGVKEAVPVVKRGARPVAYLGRGNHIVSGRFRWSAVPEALLLPPSVGLVSLELFGRAVERPQVSSKGELWLQRRDSDAKLEEDRLDISVHRKLEDGLPFHLITRFVLRISGRAREIDLGRVLPPEALPLAVQTELDYRLRSDNTFSVQGRPGVHNVTIDAVYEAPPEVIAPVRNDTQGWPKEEVWIWAADESLRSVEISGSPAVDPHRTSLAGDWTGFPTYLLLPEGKLELHETRRGALGSHLNALSLGRKVWLDLDGEGYTIQDTFSGVINRDWRLNSGAEMTLGHVSISGQDQLITADLENRASGVEIRKKDVDLIAESRIEEGTWTLDAVGWRHDVNSLGIALQLPPGWSLLGARGVDSVQGSWLSQWTLLGVFSVLFVTAASFKLFGGTAAAAAFLVFVLTHGESGAPYFIWFNMLGAAALLKVLSEGRLRSAVKLYYYGSLLVLAVIVIPFVLIQIQSGFFPQLGSAYRAGKFQLFGLVAVVLLIPTAILLSLGALVGVVYCLIKRQWSNLLYALLAAGVAGGLLLTSAVYRAVEYPHSLGSSYENFYDAANVASRAQTKELSPMPSYQTADASRMEGRLEEMEMPYEPQVNVETPMKQRPLQQVEPQAKVQTGPGVPSWQWSNRYGAARMTSARESVQLKWMGPVRAGHRVKFHFIRPGAQLLLMLLRVWQVVFLCWVFSSVPRRFAGAAGKTLLLLFLLCGFEAREAAADYPDSEILKELDERLSQDICSGNCTTAAEAKLILSADRLEIRARLNSDGAGAWAVPGPIEQFVPRTLLVDGNPAGALRRDEAGLLWVRVPGGVHDILVEGDLPKSDSITLQFGLPPEHVDVEGEEWVVDGLSPTGSVGNSLQLIRRKREEAQESRSKGEVMLSQWYLVHRELSIGIPWTVRTTVRAIGDETRSHIVRIPLLEGEAVTASQIEVEKGEAIVHVPRGVREVNWISSLSERPAVNLKADSAGRLTETWDLYCSSVFRCLPSGAAPVASVYRGEHVVRWRPWPGEAVSIGVKKPSPVEGQVVTVDGVDLVHRPGQRLIESELGLSLRSSEGGWRKVILPEGAEVEKVTIDGGESSILPRGRELSLPLVPGARIFRVYWRQPFENGVVSRMPTVNIGDGANNVQISCQIPPGRWVLFARGPKWGPVFLYWGELLVVLLAGLLLGKRRYADLGPLQWVLLGLGLSVLPVVPMLVVPLWLSALALRRKAEIRDRYLFNAVQVGLVFLTIAALGVLYTAVSMGLLGAPDMVIEGYGSNSWTLRWYVDRVAAGLPEVSVFSFPIWVWRLLLFAWSCWLVYSLLGWLRWGWESANVGGLWRTSPKSSPTEQTGAE